MNKAIVILSLFLLMQSCSSKKVLIKTAHEKHLEHQVKVSFFCSCLSKGYDSNEDVSKLISLDNSVASDYPLATSTYRAIDSLANIVALSIKKSDKLNEATLCNSCTKEEIQLLIDEGYIGPTIIGNCLKETEGSQVQTVIENQVRIYRNSLKKS